MKTFSESTLSDLLKNNLKRNLFTTPTPVQAQAIEPGIAGKDIVATAQTGTGKTLAFVLPILHRLTTIEAPVKRVQAIVLSPTRELAIQIHEVFQLMSPGSNLQCAVVVGGLSEKTQINAIRKGAQILIATPGRLCDYLNRNLVDLSGVKVLTLDEADRMLDMGFLPTINQILKATPASRQTLLFSATIEKSVKHLIDSHVKNPVRLSLGSATKPSEQVDLHLYEVSQEMKLGMLQVMLRDQPGTFLVFARTKHGAEKLSLKLVRAGIKSAAIHGARSQNQRNQALRGFQDGSYRVLVATDVAARGIHVEGIAQVVNFDLPQVPEDFIHRVGRTGRAGARGIASTFATRQERREVALIERTLGISLLRCPVPSDLMMETKAQVVVDIASAKPRTAPVSPYWAQRNQKFGGQKPSGPKFGGQKSSGPKFGGSKSSGDSFAGRRSFGPKKSGGRRAV